MRPYSHVIFDLDGTLVNSMKGITDSVAFALHSFGIEVTDKNSLCVFIGPPLVNAFMDFYGFTEEEARCAVEQYRIYYRQQGIKDNEVYPEIVDSLTKLKDAGLELWVATSKPTPFAREILETTGLASFFSQIVGAEFDGSRDTKESVLRYSLQQGKIDNTSTLLMVGDRFHDIEGAHACQIDVAAVLYGFGNREEFEQYKADYIIETPKDLLSICLPDIYQ